MKYKKEYPCKAHSITTEAYLFPNFRKGELPKFKYYTPFVLWDTGAEHTSISNEVITALQLTPKRHITIAVFGGEKRVGIYEVAIGLPNGAIFHDVEVFGAEMDEYAALIGMDIISETDFLLTNKDNKTIFQFQSPSVGHIEL